MKIAVKSVELKNFKNFKDKSIKFKDTTYISGRNATGKTTIIDGIMWVLFDKMSDGSTPTNIRPKNAKGEIEHFIDVSVTLDIEVDGKPMKLTKTNSEKWVKPRGQAEQEYGGTKNTYEVNGVPMGEKDYKAKISEIISEEIFKYASMGSFFLNLDTKKQRAKLFELVADLKPDEVIKKNKEMAMLKEVFEVYSYDEALAMAKKQIKNAKVEIEEIPIRIDELSQSRSEIDIDLKELNAKADELRSKLRGLDDIREAESHYKELVDKRGRMVEEARLRTIQEQDKKKSEINMVEAVLITTEREILSYQGKLSTLDTKLEYEQKSLESSRAKYKELAEKQIEISDECPTCGRKLNKQDYERAVKNANKAHQKELDEAVQSGKELAKRVEDIKTMKLNIEGRLLKLEENKDNKTAELNGLKHELETLAPYNADTMEIDVLIERAATKLQNIDVTLKDKYYNELMLVEGQIKIHKTNQNVDSRIAELQERQKELSQTIADAEKMQYALELFDKTRVKMLTDRVNSHFKKVKFVLFKEQINGGVQEICEATVNGIAYGKGLNTGMCLLAEIDVATAFQKIYEANVPIFVDNAEALSENTEKEINTDCQMVYLKVSNEKLEVK